MAKRISDADKLSEHVTIKLGHPIDKFTMSMGTLINNGFVPIVRCKDCKYRDKCHREVALKEYDEDFDANYVSFQKLTFCSYGKRKEDGN